MASSCFFLSASIISLSESPSRRTSSYSLCSAISFSVGHTSAGLTRVADEPNVPSIAA